MYHQGLSRCPTSVQDYQQGCIRAGIAALASPGDGIPGILDKLKYLSRYCE
ncbi:unnamed protein product [Moneuplotes crassus]|uniref:Uncharacterized protein n=1 Tax=Euplotes crassus TaxID=5936 RepID=A0AAD2D9J4_EUPCR|nr:unnamed protein product [Moneuplotes crassus]